MTLLTQLQSLIHKRSAVTLSLTFIQSTIEKFNKITNNKFDSQLLLNKANFVFDEFLISDVQNSANHHPEILKLTLKPLVLKIFPIKKSEAFISKPLPVFVCQVIFHSLQDFLISKNYQMCQVNVEITKDVTFYLLITQSICSKFLLPGAKILVTASVLYQDFVEVVEFIPLGGANVAKIHEIYSEQADGVRSLYVKIQNEKVAQILENDGGFPAVKQIWMEDARCDVVIGRVPLGSVDKE
ncbi:hypothetical protein SS50377_28120 [Spironucleus salmonicida]|uniref:Uncharacterized protein n=1 Tax=Spironucleus salmonicida TaxID=348837 RepID=V6LPX2_9EUKA|nr:hypothetical protein SS50377_28120 [Spironucleus salmonicida]|eukprot:EST42804.1 Hypothetical protein SS50377_17573 [Spironucleus salmonicida]